MTKLENSRNNKVDELRKLLKEATPGPWFRRGRNNVAIVPDFSGQGSDLPGTTLVSSSPENAALIAALRNNAEKLLAVVEAAKKMVGQPFVDQDWYVDGVHKALAALESDEPAGVLHEEQDPVGD